MPHPDGPAPTERTCWLCARPLGSQIELHHPTPRSKGGRHTVPVHPICHRTIHAHIGNSELARLQSDVAALRAHPEIGRFLAWVSGKPADFHAPTRSVRRR